MKNILIGLMILLTGFLVFSNFSGKTRKDGKALFSRETKDTTMHVAKQNYANYCASCHYDDLSWFSVRKWKYGHSPDDIRESIETGYPDLGMPSYRKTFTEDEMSGIANYIHQTLDLGLQEKQNSLGDKNYYVTERLKIRPDTIITGLNVPWGMAILPGGDMMVTEREGKMLHFRDGKLIAEIKGLPEIKEIGQGGLMDIRLHPDYKNNGWIYFAYTSPAKDGSAGWGTAIMRARLKENTLVDKELLFKAFPDSKTGHHFGCKITFDGKGHLFFGIGDRGKSENAQNLSNDCGKIHRINEDGTIPSDNPFYNTPDARKSIWSYGQRNPQGLVISPFTGELWETEHGPKGGDELNLIHPGKNYGWPVISFGINYDGSILTPDTAKAGMEQPMTYYVPSIAPSGTTFVTGNKYKGWEGNILVGSLRFRNLERIEIKDSMVVQKETLLYNIGRMRNVEMGPDGYIYVGLESPGMIIRLVPLE
jgi:glucose/arabinose dehydrogenase